ncbi:MAG: VOC family protein [Leeuwenhoekiella sp.]
MINSIAWFEIPVSDMDRAISFYQNVFDISIAKQDFGGVLMGWFPQPDNEGAASGTLIKHESYIPSEEGVLLYFNCENLAETLVKADTAGGTIYQNKTMISEDHGYMAVFLDTEGNRIALHSRM